jgi:hypothetical protein
MKMVEQLAMTSKDFNKKLWLIKNEVVTGYDTYDSVIVAADTEDEARMIHPSEYEKDWDGSCSKQETWCAAKNAIVEYLGCTDRQIPSGVILSSFNAG